MSRQPLTQKKHLKKELRYPPASPWNSDSVVDRKTVDGPKIEELEILLSGDNPRRRREGCYLQPVAQDDGAYRAYPEKK